MDVVCLYVRWHNTRNVVNRNDLENVRRNKPGTDHSLWHHVHAGAVERDRKYSAGLVALGVVVGERGWLLVDKGDVLGLEGQWCYCTTSSDWESLAWWTLHQWVSGGWLHSNSVKYQHRWGDCSVSKGAGCAPCLTTWVRSPELTW